MNTLDDVLKHHGVKGQKWGVRRSSGTSSSSKSSKTSSGHTSSEDAKKASETHSKVKSGGVHTVSNQELQHLVNRMNLERQFTTLSTQTKATSRGSKFAKEILVNVGKQQATKLASDAATKAIAAALK